MESALVSFLTVTVICCLQTGTASGVTITQTVKLSDGNTLPNIIEYNVTVQSSVPVAGVTITAGNTVFTIAGTDSIKGPSPIVGNPNFDITESAVMTWKQSTLDALSPMILVYKAQPAKDSKGVYYLPQGSSSYSAAVQFNAASNSSSLSTSSCVERVDVEQTETTVNNGYVALTLIFGLLLGAAIVVLVLFLVYRLQRQNPFSCLERRLSDSTTPYQRYRGSDSDIHTVASEEKTKKESKKGLFARKNTASLERMSKTPETNESFVAVLRLKDKRDMNRQLDRMSLSDMIRVTNELRQDQLSASLLVTRQVVTDLATSETISRSTVNKCLQTFNKKVNASDKKLDSELKQRAEKLSNELRNRNKEEQNALSRKQQKQLEIFKKRANQLQPQEIESIEKLMIEEHELERNNFLHRLQLLEYEEMEKLKMELFTQKCLELSRLEREFVSELSSVAKLSSEQSEWIATELHQNELKIHKIFTDASTKRFAAINLTKKKRKNLIASEDFHNQQNSEVLNTIAAQQLKLISLAMKAGQLSESSVRRLKSDVKQDLSALRTDADNERESEELTLLQQFNEHKKTHLQEQWAQQEQKLIDATKQQQATLQTSVSETVASIDTIQSLKTERVEHMCAVENQIDAQQTADLYQLHSKLTERMQNDLLSNKEGLAQDMQQRGVSGKKLDTWLDSQDDELKELKQEQKKENKQHENDAKKRLNQQFQQRSFDETQQEFDDSRLTEYKQNVIRKLLDNQVALTDTEREQLRKDFDKSPDNKTQDALDLSSSSSSNSVVLTELCRQRTAANKWTQKMTTKLETLAKKHSTELQKLLKSSGSRNSRNLSDKDDDDEVDNAEELLSQQIYKLLLQQCEQRLAVWRTTNNSKQLDTSGTNNQTTEERLLKQQANAVRQREEQLGAIIAQLQFNKARPMVEAEELKRVIHRLTFSVAADLTERRRVLSTADCQHFLHRHHQELEQLTAEVDNQEKADEKAVRKALRETQLEKLQRLSTQEDNLSMVRRRGSGDQAEWIQEHINTGLTHVNNILAQDQLVLQLERESHQTMEELRRRYRIQRSQLIQQRELEFLSALTKAGRYEATDLEPVITSTVPTTWTAEQRKQLLDRLCHKPPPASTVKPLPADTKNKAKTGLFNRNKTNQETTTAAATAAERPATDDRLTDQLTSQLGIIRRSLVDDSQMMSSKLTGRSDRPTTPTRPIIKLDTSPRFETPVVRPRTYSSSYSNDDSSPSYNKPPSPYNYRRNENTLLAIPSPPRTPVLPTLNVVKKRKTVRVAESNEYYSDYNDYNDYST